MANTITSPNMGLPIPNPGVDTGPDWANNLNSSLGIVDIHDHSPGFGVQITPAGFNINTDLTFASNNAINLRTVRFANQNAALSLASDLGCLYEVGVDLYYNDGNGNQVRITQSGGVAGSPGSISSLVSPASASYSVATTTFIWQSDVNTPANMDAAAYVFRNLSASSKGLTLSPPAAMGADYNLTLPALPGSQSFMTLSAAGAMATPVAYPLPTAGLASQAVTAAKIADATITTTQIAAATILASNIASGVIPGGQTQTFTAGGTFSVPSGCNWVAARLVAGGGGGGAGTGAQGGGGGGGGSPIEWQLFKTTPAETLTVVIGTGGAGGTAPTGNGSDGVASTVTNGSSVVVAKAFGGKKGFGGSAGQDGTGGLNVANGQVRAAGGQGGGGISGSLIAAAGEDSSFASGGARGGNNTLSGGGGGAALAAGGAGGAAGGTHAGVAAAANSGGGGGGGGESSNGGAGGSGHCILYWIGV